jgi:hypothetical protein
MSLIKKRAIEGTASLMDFFELVDYEEGNRNG